MVRRILLAVLTGWAISFALGTTAARALDGEAASAFVDQLTHDAITTLSASDLSRQDRAQAVRDLVTRYGNMEQIAAELLGRTWTSASAEERAEFEYWLVDYFVVLCSGMTNDMSGDQKIVVVRSEPRGERVMVHSLALTDDTPVVLDWLVGATGGGRLFLADVSAEGVSLVRTMRSDFRAVLFANAGRLDALLVTMKRKIEVALN